eukprot:6200292-Pleurochrysis_carterae.AAC.1
MFSVEILTPQEKHLLLRGIGRSPPPRSGEMRPWTAWLVFALSWPNRPVLLDRLRARRLHTYPRRARTLKRTRTHTQTHAYAHARATAHAHAQARMQAHERALAPTEARPAHTTSAASAPASQAFPVWVRTAMPRFIRVRWKPRVLCNGAGRI